VKKWMTSTRSRNVVTVKVASQITSLMHWITPGTVSKLIRYNAVPFFQSTSQSAQLWIALIVTNFEICRTIEVPETLIRDYGNPRNEQCKEKKPSWLVVYDKCLIYLWDGQAPGVANMSSLLYKSILSKQARQQV
jgi:hypothetical protein